MSDKRVFTLTEAAETTGTHRNTIRRRLDDKQFPHTWQEEDRTWRIPVEDLVASGLKLGGRAKRDAVLQETDLERLRAEIADLRRRAEVAEARAEERERALQLAERLLEARTR